MSFQDVLYEKKAGVAWITINRPQVLNVLRWETVAELTEAFEDAEKDPAIGVAVLTAAGDKAFCVGGDISVMSALDHQSGQEWNRVLLRLSTAMRNLSKPVIAAVNGYCIGGGNELNVFCDLTIASDRAKFGQAGPKVGACPVWGATQMLPRIMGEKKAREMIFLCEQYTAEEAEQLGLVNKVVPHEELYTEVQKWCDKLLDMSPQSLRLAKVSLNFESDLMYPSLTHGSALLSYVWGSEQVREGFGAFREKRKPNFRAFRK